MPRAAEGAGGESAAKRLKVGDKVSVPALQFDDMEAVRAGAKRWSETRYGARWRTAVVTGVVLSRPAAGKWEIEFEDDTVSVVERRFITLIQALPAAPPVRVLREDVTEIEGDGELDSDSSSEEEGDCDAPAGAIPQVSGAVHWSKEECAPTHDQRAKQGFPGQQIPAFSAVAGIHTTGLHQVGGGTHRFPRDGQVRC